MVFKNRHYGKNYILSEELSYLKPVIVNDLVRIGNKNDGGYVLPKSSLDKIDLLITFGLSIEWSFEEELIQIKPTLNINAYDYTVKLKLFIWHFMVSVYRFLNFRGSLKDILSKLFLYKKYKDFFSHNCRHFKNRISETKNKSYDIQIPDIFNTLKEDSKLILKMDIEGDEYKVIDDILLYQKNIYVLLIEFHNTDKKRDIFEKNIKKIQENFNIVHVHGNNYGKISHDGLPETLEISFLNKASFQFSELKRDTLPIEGLDFPNNPEKADYQLKFC